MTISDSLITHLDQVTPEWLTAVLRRSGALEHGAVTGFDIDAGRGNWSTSGSLRLRYTPDATGERPPRLFLKMVDTDLGDGEYFGPSEVEYYIRDYIDVPDAPLLRCYDGQFSPELQRYHLLLADISDTHILAADKSPTLEYGLALAEGLAALHARWWGAERLAAAGAPIHNADHILRFVRIAEPGVGHILGRFAAELEPHWPAAMRDLFARHPQAMIDRGHDLNGFTLIHGDTGEHNIMVPRDGDKPLYLIDRQPFNWSLTTWLGAYDLAYAMVLDWDIDSRRSWEIPVLQHYHKHLISHGIVDYSWRRLIDDYRLCVAMGVYIAVEYSRGGINERWIAVTMKMLQRTLAACDDLQVQSTF
jgi:hypothetical protein